MSDEATLFLLLSDDELAKVLLLAMGDKQFGSSLQHSPIAGYANFSHESCTPPGLLRLVCRRWAAVLLSCVPHRVLQAEGHVAWAASTNPQLTSVDVRAEALVTRHGLEHLFAQLPAVSRLAISVPDSIQMPDVWAIPRAEQLQELKVLSPAVCGHGDIARLVGLPVLHTLEMQSIHCGMFQNPLHAEGPEEERPGALSPPESKLDQLRVLRFDVLDMAECCAFLSACVHLRELELIGAAVPNSHASRSLRNLVLPRLEALSFRNCEWRSERRPFRIMDWQGFTALRCLRFVTCSGSLAGDQGFTALEGLTELQLSGELRLSGVCGLHRLVRLRKLVLATRTPCSPNFVPNPQAYLTGIEQLSRLEELRVRGHPYCWSLKAMPPLNNLKVVELPLPFALPQSPQALLSLPCLRELILTEVSSSDAAWVDLWCSKITAHTSSHQQDWALQSITLAAGPARQNSRLDEVAEMMREALAQGGVAWILKGRRAEAVGEGDAGCEVYHILRL